MCGEDICRLTFTEDENGNIKVTADLHGLSKKNAIRMISNILVLCSFKFELEVVHGYNHGTAIKEYIFNQMHNDRVIHKQSPFYNPGITDLMIAAA